LTGNSLIEISKGVHIFIPPPDRVAGWRRSGNIIFLNNSDELYIIDSGGPSVKNQLSVIINKLFLNKSKPVHCVHTHGHIDHMAGARELQKSFNADIWASEDAIPFVENQAPIHMGLERDSIIVSFRELFTAPSWFVRAAMWVALGRTQSLASVKLLEKSSRIGGTGFRPVELPGHHYGHMGFYNEDESILIVGDLIDPRHKMKPILTAPSSDFAGMKSSLETVLQIAPETLLPGHGEPITGEEKIQAAILKAQETMQAAHDRVIEVLESESSTLPELSKHLLRMGLGPGDVLRRMFIHSILRYLVSTGKVSRRKASRGRTIFSI
jgi:glyoxylase-like metal-dependent hydrolase (beta-lactamase superfamily II)